MIRLIKVKINEIVDLNGSVIGFFFIYFLPSILHLRCLYFSKNKITSKEKALLDAQNENEVIDSSRKSDIKVELSEHRNSNDPYAEDSERKIKNRILSGENELP